jgi:hypothetical protein
MSNLHVPLACLRGTGACYDPLPYANEETPNANSLRKPRFKMTRCDMLQQVTKTSTATIAACGVPVQGFLANTVEEQIIDFLDGRTDGEELLHALHDHILDEPIPERMLALFRTRSAD